MKAAAQEKDDVVVEVGSGSYRFAYDGAALAARLNPPARFTTRTPVEGLLASPEARAVLDRRLPGFTTDPRVQQALRMNLREIAPYAPAIFTEEMLKALDDDLRGDPRLRHDPRDARVDLVPRRLRPSGRPRGRTGQAARGRSFGRRQDRTPCQ